MKIAFFTDSFYPSVNGVASSILNFAEGLVELGHEVLIFAPKHPRGNIKDLDLDKRVKVVLLPSVDSRVYRDLRVSMPMPKIWRRLKSFNPDVIHSHSPFLIGLSGLVLGRRMKVPVVFTHGTKFDHEDVLKILGKFKVPFVEVVHRKGVPGLTRRYLAMHDKIIVSTENTKKDLERMGLKKEVSVVRIPVPVNKLQQSEAVGREKKRSLGIEKALIFIGRLSPEKNLDVSLQIFAKLVKKHKQLKFVLVGDGEWRNKLFEEAAKLGVLERIVWVGELDYPKLVVGGYFYLGDVFVTLSRFETQGLSTVEAMACGLVPVVVKETASEEVVGKAGVSVEFGKLEQAVMRIDKLLDNGNWKLLSNQAKNRATEFGVVKCSEKLVEVYEEVLSDR